MEEKPIINVMDLFQDKELVKVCAPMVRYSKLPFRNLVKKYGCDLTFTSMILADSFCKSPEARRAEFTTNYFDSPVITQFAANSSQDFVGAAKLVSPFCNGVDLNCGCPQRWARNLGLGCVMLKNPQIIYDLVRDCRNQIDKPFTVSVKMRLLPEIRETLEVCQQLEHCGISFLTIHGRTPSQITGSVNTQQIKQVNDLINVPVIANGGAKTLENCQEIQKETGCKGVMVANSLLTNPTLFCGQNTTSLDCIQNWLNICYNSCIAPEEYHQFSQENSHRKVVTDKTKNISFQCFHHHLVFMLEKVLPRWQRRIFNQLNDSQEVFDFVEKYLNLRPELYDFEEFSKIQPRKIDFLQDNFEENSEVLYDYNTKGKYFESKVEEDFSLENIFEEN